MCPECGNNLYYQIFRNHDGLKNEKVQTCFVCGTVWIKVKGGDQICIEEEEEGDVDVGLAQLRDATDDL